ncbi:MAG TPA: helix-turn-helix domain-containing protein [Thermoleophilaceae bacterium]
MPKAVQQRRSYNSPRRAEQAAATRGAIVDAAQRLFERDGYAATSMASIAKEAGVALKTVYLAFETKSGLLRALWHARLRGDEGAAPVGERDWYRRVLDEPDPVRQLQLNARNSREVKARAGALMEVIRSGARADADVAGLWHSIQTQFHDNQRAIVKSLHAKKALARGLGVERATDVLWTLNHPDVYTLLVSERGWSPKQYEKWLADSTAAQLLRQQ